MKLAARSSAILFAVLMAAPSLPVAVASHADVVPNAPPLGNVKPGDECVGVGISADALAAANAVATQDTNYFAYDRTVPALCGPAGKVQQWSLVLDAAQSVVDGYRSTSAELQRQADLRGDATLPQPNCAKENNVTTTVPAGHLDCGVTRPRYTLLSDGFDGRRVGGFGDWTVVTEKGEAPALHPETVDTFGGTIHAYRFGDATGYARGIHQWLVSPELDLQAMRQTAGLAIALNEARLAARSQLDTLCGASLALPDTSGNGQGSGFVGIGLPFTGVNVCDPQTQLVITAYKQQLDGDTAALPLSRETATLDFLFRSNLKPGVDGVRVWIYRGTTAPTRLDLYDASFGTGPSQINCDAVDPVLQPVRENLTTCYSRNATRGAAAVDPVDPQTGLAVTSDTLAFSRATEVAQAYHNASITGDQKDFRVAHVNLSQLEGTRAWVLFEVKTEADKGRGEPYFDPLGFPRQDGSFGFELQRVDAYADGFLRDMRVKDVAGTYAPIPRLNDWKDDPGTTRTVGAGVEPPVVVRLHNAGHYTENVSLTVKFQETVYDGATSLGSPHRFGEDLAPIDVKEIKPDEIRLVSVPWPAERRDGSLYAVTANLTAKDVGTLPPLTDPKTYAEPNTVPVHPVNQAAEDGKVPGGAQDVATGVVRAATQHRLTPVRFPTGEVTSPIDVCKKIDPKTGCAAADRQYTAPKGERRVVFVGVRNDGNSVQDATATLVLRLDGVDKGSYLVDDATRTLHDLQPGETRLVAWTLAPAEAGVYDAQVALRTADPKDLGTITSRLLFVQRSPGLVCFDDLMTDRECGPSFTASKPEAFHGADITAIAIDGDGTTYATTTVSDSEGALFVRPLGGEWTNLTSISNSTLAAATGTLPRLDDPATPDRYEGVPYANVSAISFDGKGTIVLVGAAGTAIARDPDGKLRAIPIAGDASGPLAASPSEIDPRVTVMAGQPAPLAGSAHGGSPPYAFAWSVVDDKRAGYATSGTFADASAGPTTFTPDLVANYLLHLKVTDAAGNVAETNTTVTATRILPTCADNEGVVGVDKVGEGDSGAADATCLHVADHAATGDITFRLDLASGAGSKPVSYWLNVSNAQIPQGSGQGSRSLTATRAADGTFAGATATNASNGAVSLSWTLKRSDLAIQTSGATLRLDAVAVAAGSSVPDSLPGDVTLDTDLAAPTRVADLAALPARTSATGIQLTWTASTDAQKAITYTVSRALSASGPYGIVGTTTYPAFNDTGLETGRTYHYEVVAADDQSVSGCEACPTNSLPAPAPVAAAPAVPLPRFFSAATFAGASYFAGSAGTLWRLDAGTLVPIHLDAAQDYVGDLHALLATPTRLYVAGEFGHVLASVDGATFADAKVPKGTAFDVRTMATHDGVVFAAGTGGHILRSVAADQFVDATPPPTVGARLPDYSVLFDTRAGSLFALDTTGRLASCGACAVADAAWDVPVVPVPMHLSRGKAVPTLLTGAASRGATTTLVGEAGVVLDYAQRSAYADRGDWSTTPSLLAHDGTAIDSIFGGGLAPGVAIRLTPPAAASTDTRAFTFLRVKLHHFLANVSAQNPAEVRVFFLPYPTYAEATVTTTVPSTCQGSSQPFVGTIPQTNSLTVCDNGLVMVRTNFTTRSTQDGWNEFSFVVPAPNLPVNSGTTASSQPTFAGLELYRSKYARWAIDDVVVESTNAAVPTERDWKVVSQWYGDGNVPAPHDTIGTLAPTNVDPTPGGSTGGAIADESSKAWVTDAPVAFGYEAQSPWHLSTLLADRPVWVANDELLSADHASWTNLATGGADAHLLSTWDSRLLTPIIDLGQAYSPVLTFRHAYAFRTAVSPASNTADWGDAGRVELQYQMSGAECGASDPTVTCWSRFFVLYPDRVDANGTVSTEYPRPEDINLAGTAILNPHVGATETPDGQPYGGHASSATPPDPTVIPAYSYWGHSPNTIPNDLGVIAGPRDTSTYEPVTIRLDPTTQQTAAANAHDVTGGLPVNVSGRAVRVAFHVVTLQDPSSEVTYNFTLFDPTRGTTPASFPGEGWYLTDLKIKGARELASDLRASDVRFNVGYDAAALGVGPGTDVPVNVTIENRGAFDVDGYTGDLEVRRVTDAVALKSEVVAHVPLPQQPLLAAHRSINVTIPWSVPANGIVTANAAAGAVATTAFRIPPANDARALVPLAVELATRGHGPLAVKLLAGDVVVAGFDRVQVDGGFLRLPTLQLPALDAQGAPIDYALQVDASAYDAPVTATVATQWSYVLSFTAHPLGVDEDPTDNVATLGTLSAPVLAKAEPQFHVELQVTPENATTDIVRFVPTFLNNTGNVPLASFVVTRSIDRLGVLDEQRAWHSARAVLPGTRVTLQSVSDDFDATNDAFWKAPAHSDFHFVVGATGRYGDAVLASVTDRTVTALATYAFDSVDGGLSGLAIKSKCDPAAVGSWCLGAAWAAQQPGFRSDQAYVFGDPVTGRYPADANASLVTPVIDLSAARSARIGFYTNYALEKSFDGGLVEISADGGKTWQAVAPEPFVDLEGKTHPGYNETPLSAASALHPTHDPADAAYAFTGDSTAAPDNVNGWVYREIDLTNYANVTEEKVPYERFDSPVLGRYLGTGLKDELKLHPSASPNAYFDQSWSAGDVTDYRYWETQNLTESTLKSPTGHGTVWWSGSASLADDQKRVDNNYFLKIPVASALAAAQPDDTVVVDWWEYAERYASRIEVIKPGDDYPPIDQIAGGFSFANPYKPAATYRINVTPPNTAPHLIETRGKWFHYQTDITQFLSSPRAATSPYAVSDIEFAYTPLLNGNYSSSVSSGSDVWSDQRVIDRYADDPGFAIDGFTISAFKVANGQVTGKRDLLTQDDAWSHSVTLTCTQLPRHWADLTPQLPPVWSESGDARRMPCASDHPEARIWDLPLAGARALVQADGTAVGTTLPSGLAAAATTDSVSNAVVDFRMSGVAPGDVAYLTDLPIPLAGTVDVTKSSYAIVGHGTNFTQDLRPGSTFAVEDAFNAQGWKSTNVTVDSIQDDTHLTATLPWTDNSDASVQSQTGKAIFVASRHATLVVATVSAHEIKFTEPHAFATTTTMQIAKRMPVGVGWNLVAALPAAPATWHTVAVQDIDGHSATNKLPTGEVPKAWYTGSECNAVAPSSPPALKMLDPTVTDNGAYFQNSRAQETSTDPGFTKDQSLAYLANAMAVATASASADFVAQGVRPGDLVMFASGSATSSYHAVVRTVDTKEVTFDPILRVGGLEIAQGSNAVVGVGTTFLKDNLLAGDVILVQDPSATETGGWRAARVASAPTANAKLALQAWSGGDLHGAAYAVPIKKDASGMFAIVRLDVQCMRPGEDVRLVTPSFDLSKVAGKDIELTFDHRYAFRDTLGVNDARAPFASGGVVELQSFDPVTQTWGSWSQIYATSDMDAGPKSLMTTPTANGLRGGYSAYTVTDSKSGLGNLRNDLTFDTVRAPDLQRDVQFLYSGASTDVTHDPTNGWLKASFDLSQYRGSKVRLGFHVETNGAQRNAANLSTAQTQLCDPDGPFPVAGGACFAAAQHAYQDGWWITNVSLVGKVLHGAPIQARFRAASDGDVQDGHWAIDDIGVFGSRYGRNLGIFVDESPGAYGAFANNTTIVPIELRNLGDSVRHDVAVRVKSLTGAFKVALADGGQAPHVKRIGDDLYFYGYNLAPGQTAIVDLAVTAPPTIGGLSDGKTFAEIALLATVRECSSGPRAGTSDVPCGDGLGDEFVDVSDNEIQGFLNRQIQFHALPAATLRIDTPYTTVATGKPGEPIDVFADVEMLQGYSDVPVTLSCDAVILGEHDAVNHNKDHDDVVHAASTFPCTPVTPKATIHPGPHGVGVVTVAFRAVPDRTGLARFRVNGTYRFDNASSELAAKSVTASIGVPTVLFHEDFTPINAERVGAPHFERPKETTLQQNWSTPSGSSPAAYAYPRGHGAAGSVLLGQSDQAADAGQPYNAACPANGGRCGVASPPIDLHNFTDEHVVLSFWHLPRFARDDGGQLTAQVLLDERNPGASSSWSNLTTSCVMSPREGYTGAISEIGAAAPNQQNPPPPDTNGYGEYTSTIGSQTAPPNSADVFAKGFYVSRGGVWSDEWQLATVDLSQQRCLYNAENVPANYLPILGHTVRFVWTAYTGAPTGSMNRGPGQGWLIDDVSLGMMGISLAPAQQPVDPTQLIVLQDNSSKAFNLLVTNHASWPDTVRFAYDDGNSSAPQGSVKIPADVTLAPGQTKTVAATVTLPRDPSLLPTRYKARLVATSLLDPAATADAKLEFAFAPRQWSELSVSAIAPRGVVQEGTDTFVPITVENDGLVASVPSSLVVHDAWPGGSKDWPAIDLPAISAYFQRPDDATRVLEFRWRPERGSIGEHTLTIVADPLALGQEYTRTNNLVTLKVPVSELLVPDIDVSGADALKIRDITGAALAGAKDADVTRYEVVAGELASLEVAVKNTGRAGATNVDVRAFVGPLSLPPKTIPYIAPGSEVVLSFNWLAQKGEYPIQIVARSEQVEASSDNNQNPARGVTLLVVKGYDIHVAIEPVAGILAPGGPSLKMPFTITNAGNAGEDLILRATAPDGWSVQLPRASFFLAAGAPFSGTASLRIPEDAVAGEQFIRLEAIARENPMKVASASASVRVNATYAGSVVPTTAAAAPPASILPITLANEGNSLEPWTVRVTLPSGWVAAEALPLKVAVPAHGAATVDLHVSVPEATAPGPRPVEIKATMADGTVREGKVSVDVKAFRSAAAKVASEKPAEAVGTLRYAVTVQNSGNVQQPFTMVLLDGGTPGLDAKIEPSSFTLAPGAKTVATLVVTPGAQLAAGSYHIPAYTLFSGVQPTSVEGKANVQSLDVELIRPDLRVAPLEYAPRADVSPGDVVRVSVHVTNRGQGATSDLPVHLFVDDVFVGETRLASVGAGETRGATINWTATPGQHTILAVVDPYKDTVDGDRADNSVSALVAVKTPTLSGIAGGAKVPAPGADLMILAAAAVAIALAGRRRAPR